MTIAENVAVIRERMARAAAKSGRNVNEITLVGVTKLRSVALMMEVCRAGVTDLGENRVQESVPKFVELTEKGCAFRRHLIGHLQTNKAKAATLHFDVIHSVDSARLAAELQKHAERAQKKTDILLEVNVSGEESKYGLPPASVGAILEQVSAQCPNLNVRGLMTMAPYLQESEETRPVFAGLRQLSETLRAQFPTLGAELSMGMTNDFEVAIEEGATIIRVGTALFSDLGTE